VGAKDTCRNLFKKLDILPVSCQYILSLMMLVVDNLKNYQTNLPVRGLDTRTRISCICLLLIFCVFREVFPTLLWRSVLLYQIISRVLGMTECSLNFYYMIILFLVHFIHWHNSLSIYKYTVMYQTQQNFIMFIVVLGQHVLILIESSSGHSKKIDPYTSLYIYICVKHFRMADIKKEIWAS